MRTAALILVLMLVVAIATEADGFWFRRRGRRSRGGIRRSRTSRSRSRRCRSCSCCRRRRIGKRSVEAGEDIAYEDDAILLEDQAFLDKWQPLEAGVSKSRQKRANELKYPRDCISSKLQNFARSCGLCVKRGGSHIKVCTFKGNRQVTVIPHHVKDNGTCRGIIKTLNRECP